MPIQIITFQLKDISAEEFRTHCEQIASAFASLPRLISKIWLANPKTNTSGGAYLWQDRQAMEHYIRSDIYEGRVANPHFDSVIAQDFTVLVGPAQVTRSLGEVAVHSDSVLSSSS